MIKAQLNSLSLIIINGGLSIRNRDLTEKAISSLNDECNEWKKDFQSEKASLKRLFLFRGGDDVNGFYSGDEWKVEDVKECLYGMREMGTVSNKITSFKMPLNDDIHHF